MQKAGQVRALLSTLKPNFGGKDPIGTKPKHIVQPKSTSNLTRGPKGDPQVKGIKAKGHNQKPISFDPKNVKIGGTRSKKLSHDHK